MDRLRKRVLEAPSGKGKVYEDKTFLCDATYSLQVFQEEITSTTFGRIRSAEGHKEIKGVLGKGALNLLIGKERLTLHLQDGRLLDFFLTSTRSGAITATGGFYKPEGKEPYFRPALLTPDQPEDIS